MEDKKQELKDKKQKYAYWMRPSLVDEMNEMLESANATSKSDFVCQAVEFYMICLHTLTKQESGGATMFRYSTLMT